MENISCSFFFFFFFFFFLGGEGRFYFAFAMSLPIEKLRYSRAALLAANDFKAPQARCRSECVLIEHINVSDTTGPEDHCRCKQFRRANSLQKDVSI